MSDRRGALTRPFRAIARAITPGQPGAVTVTRGQSTEGNVVLWRDKTAGQTWSDLRFVWWPGAGSNRRPSDFQSEFGAAATIAEQWAAHPVLAGLHDRRVNSGCAT
jgi:hypothetical protein